MNDYSALGYDVFLEKNGSLLSDAEKVQFYQTTSVDENGDSILNRVSTGLTTIDTSGLSQSDISSLINGLSSEGISQPINVVAGHIQSVNFLTGSKGWRIDSDGNIEANDGYFRGNITGATGTFTGAIRGGQTAYNTGTGFWMGWDASAGGSYKFSIGDPDGQYLYWDGTNLVFNGSASLIGTLPWSAITNDGNRPADNATVGATWGTNLLNIPSTLSTPSTAGLYLSGNYLGYYNGATWNAYIDNSGNFYFKGSADSSIDWNITTGGKLTIKGGTIDDTSTIGGRTASTLAAAIDSSGHFADSSISTASNTILGSFNFTGSGALQIGTYVNGVSGDVKISPTGILARDSAGATTFSINGTTGVAVLNGLVVGTNVGLGTAQTSAQVTTIIGNTVTTGFVNALNITADSVAAEDITGTYLTGKTVRTANAATRVEMSAAGDYPNCLTVYEDGYERVVIGGGAIALLTPLGVGSGSIYGVGTNMFALSVGGTDGLYLDESALYPITNSGTDLGTTSYKFKDLLLTGNITVGGTVDGVDVSSHVADASAHHSSVSNSLSITPHSVAINGATIGTSHLSIDGDMHIYNGSIDIKSSGSVAWAGVATLAATTNNLVVYKYLNVKTSGSDPTGSAGLMYFNTGTGRFRGHDGSTWRDLCFYDERNA